jgi:hypothetical protein
MNFISAIKLFARTTIPELHSWWNIGIGVNGSTWIQLTHCVKSLPDNVSQIVCPVDAVGASKRYKKVFVNDKASAQGKHIQMNEMTHTLVGDCCDKCEVS